MSSGHPVSLMISVVTLSTSVRAWGLLLICLSRHAQLVNNVIMLIML